MLQWMAGPIASALAKAGRRRYEWAAENGPFQSEPVDMAALGAGVLSMVLPDGTSLVARLDPSAQGSAVVLGGRPYAFAAYDARSLTARRSAVDAHHGPLTLTSPMPGRIVRILCLAGTAVSAKQGVLMVEAMKMQNELKSPRAGVVESVLVKEGDSVVAGQALAVVR
jgi:biotin carboxyl carrier protein